MNMQKLLDTLSEAGRRDRSHYHVTLGKLIKALKELPLDMPVKFSHGGAPHEPHSYRGYYSDLSFHTTDDMVTVGSLLNECNEAFGKAFEGYKGGDFVMGENTPLWNAAWGDCGDAIVDAAVVDNCLILTTKNIDD